MDINSVERGVFLRANDPLWLGFSGSEWVGVEHFRFMFERDDSVKVIRNTFVISALKLVFGLAAAILFALLLNEVRKMTFKRTVQTLVYMPHFLADVVEIKAFKMKEELIV